MGKPYWAVQALETISEIYVLLLMLVFPLFSTDAYFDILNNRFYFFWYTTLAAAAAVVFFIIMGMILDDKGDFTRGFIRQIKQKKSAADRFFLMFFLVSVLATVSSDYVYEAFWGNMGRHQGLFLWIFYIIAYFVISRFYVFKKWHLNAGIGVGVIIAVWGIADFFHLDPLGWQGIIQNQVTARMFSSSIGNINTLTSLEAMYLALASVLAVTEENRRDRILYFGASEIFLISLAAGSADNGVLSMAALCALLPFFSFHSLKRLIRLMILAAEYFAGLLLLGIGARAFPDRILYEWDWGVLIRIAITKQGLLIAGLAVALLMISVLVILAGKREDVLPKILIRVWSALLIVLAVAGVFVVLDANFGKNPDRYGTLSHMLVFDDDWGTHRGYNWRLLFTYFAAFPFWKKLIGAGPETYGIYTNVYNHYDMIKKYNEVFDSPHSEPLQVLFSTGILGFVSFYGAIIAAFFHGIRNPDGQSFSAALLVYAASSLVNISVPIVFPFVILCIAVCENLSRNETK